MMLCVFLLIIILFLCWLSYTGQSWCGFFKNSLKKPGLDKLKNIFNKTYSIAMLPVISLAQLKAYFTIDDSMEFHDENFKRLLIDIFGMAAQNESLEAISETINANGLEITIDNLRALLLRCLEMGECSKYTTQIHRFIAKNIDGIAEPLVTAHPLGRWLREILSDFGSNLIPEEGGLSWVLVAGVLVAFVVFVKLGDESQQTPVEQTSVSYSAYETDVYSYLVWFLGWTALIILLLFIFYQVFKRYKVHRL